MPHADIAKSTLDKYQSVLGNLKKELKARSPKPESFDQTALDEWKLAREFSKAPPVQGQ
jgi:hypothetical protein